MMRARGLLLLVLLALVAGLAGLVLRGAPAPTPEPARLLGTLAPETLQRIRIEAPGRATLALERHATGWHLVAPYRVPANPAQVETALRITALTSLAHYPLAGRDRADYGLETPALRITLNDVSVAFGAVEPLEGRRYVQVGDTLHLIADRAYYRLQAPPETWVSPRLLPETAALEAVHAHDWRLELRDSQWRAEPALDTADAVVEWVDRWRRVQALRVRAYRGEALEAPIALHLKGEAPLQLAPLAEGEALVRTDLGLVYELPAGALARLVQPPAGF